MGFFNEEVNEELDKKGGSFYKFQAGKNVFRIVSDFAWGYQFNYQHREEGKSLDHPFFKISAPEAQDNKEKMQLTCVMVIFDYADNEFKILYMTQKNILNAIREYNDNPKYGDPTSYDLTVSKTGEGKETRYSTIADPPEDFSKDLKAKFAKIKINMDNLFEGGEIIESIE